MKKLLIGNAAIARGLYEAGVKVVSSYPGTPSTEITEFAAKYDEIYCEWAPNEKVATEVAFGAALGGARSACAMKHVGLNVAADPLFTLSYTGVRAGMVICVADDPAMHSSQNEQDSRHYAIAAKIPMLEPADSQEAYDFAKAAFDISEKYDTPVMIRTCTRIAHCQSIVDIGERVERDLLPYEKQPEKYIMMPGYAKKKHPVVEERTKVLTEFSEDCRFNKVFFSQNNDIGIVTSGTCYQYVKEVFGDSVSVFKIGLINPMPVKSLIDFASKVKRLIVVEELDPIIETHLKTIGLNPEGKNLFSNIGEFSQNDIKKIILNKSEVTVKTDTSVPNRPPVMCPGCPHRGIYYVLAKMKLTVLGDIGCYTLGAAPPLCALDSTLCMGASVSGIHGFNKARGSESENKTVCVIGDSTFMHSGMTGHQQNPTTGYNIKGDPATKVNLEKLCNALGIMRVRVVDPYNLSECEKAVKEELTVNEPSVIISRRPCMLLKYVKPKPALNVCADKCRACKSCMRLGCPAISMHNGKAVIDATQCVGCGVCKQLCPFEAIKEDIQQ